jgi:hypothetical protein
MSGKEGELELSTRQLLAQGLVVELPSKDFGREQIYNGWSLLKDETRGLALWVRLTAARRNVTLAECEAESTRSLSILRRHKDVLEPLGTFRTSQFFGGFWGVRSEAGPSLWVVHAVNTARCLSAVYATEPSRDAAFWLAVGRELVLPSLRQREVGDRASSQDRP